jgi:hypothetical protein
MRISILQGLGAPDRPKKKIKYAEIDFTPHSSSRVRRDHFLPNCKKPTLIARQMLLQTSVGLSQHSGPIRKKTHGKKRKIFGNFEK